MSVQLKIIIALALALALSAWGNLHCWQTRGAGTAPSPAAAASSQIAAAPQVDEHERVVTELKCPDGAVIRQTTSERSAATAPATASSSASAASPAASSYDPPRYSVGAEVDPRSPKENNEVRVGARLGNLPLRATVGAGLRDGKLAATLGFDIDL
jgi:hypothetical protein